MEALVDIAGDVNIDGVTFLQWTVIWDAVTHYVVDRGAN